MPSPGAGWDCEFEFSKFEDGQAIASYCTNPFWTLPRSIIKHRLYILSDFSALYTYSYSSFVKPTLIFEEYTTYLYSISFFPMSSLSTLIGIEHVISYSPFSSGLGWNAPLLAFQSPSGGPNRICMHDCSSQPQASLGIITWNVSFPQPGPCLALCCNEVQWISRFLSLTILTKSSYFPLISPNDLLCNTDSAFGL